MEHLYDVLVIGGVSSKSLLQGIGIRKRKFWWTNKNN